MPKTPARARKAKLKQPESTFELSPHATRKKYSIVVKNVEQRPDLQTVFNEKPAIMGLFHEIFGLEALKRVQVLLGKIAREGESWQKEMVPTETPENEPGLMTAAITAYRRFGTGRLQRHFHHSLEMVAGCDFWENWETMTDLVNASGDTQGIEVEDEHREIYVWIEREMKDHPKVPKDSKLARLKSYFMERMYGDGAEITGKEDKEWTKNLGVTHALHALSRVFGKGVFVLMPIQYRTQ